MSIDSYPAKTTDLDIRVIPDKEMPGLLNISPATWERSKKAGDRPAVTQLSSRRIGYRVDHIRHWLDGKRRSSGAPMTRVLRERIGSEGQP